MFIKLPSGADLENLNNYARDLRWSIKADVLWVTADGKSGSHFELDIGGRGKRVTRSHSNTLYLKAGVSRSVLHRYLTSKNLWKIFVRH
jgi:hypothetical protein